MMLFDKTKLPFPMLTTRAIIWLNKTDCKICIFLTIVITVWISILCLLTMNNCARNLIRTTRAQPLNEFNCLSSISAKYQINDKQWSSDFRIFSNDKTVVWSKSCVEHFIFLNVKLIWKIIVNHSTSTKMINNSFELSCKCFNKFYLLILNLFIMFFLSISNAADDDSDTNPQDFDNPDVEYGLGSHLNIGQHSFSQMQVNIREIIFFICSYNTYGIRKNNDV